MFYLNSVHVFIICVLAISALVLTYLITKTIVTKKVDASNKETIKELTLSKYNEVNELNETVNKLEESILQLIEEKEKMEEEIERLEANNALLIDEYAFNTLLDEIDDAASVQLAINEEDKKFEEQIRELENEIDILLKEKELLEHNAEVDEFNYRSFRDQMSKYISATNKERFEFINKINNYQKELHENQLRMLELKREIANNKETAIEMLNSLSKLFEEYASHNHNTEQTFLETINEFMDKLNNDLE